MKKILTAILLLAVAGASRADGEAAPPPAAGTPAPERAAKAESGKHGGTKAKPKAKRADAAAKPPAREPEASPDPKGTPPCEPVKPCPID